MDNEKNILLEDGSKEKKGKKPKRERKPKREKKSKRGKKVSYNPTKTGPRKNLIIVGSLAILVIVISAVIFLTLTTLFSTENYYVLNTNVKAKQQITPEMVVVRETAKDTGPINALTMEEIQQGGVYSKYPLYAGDVIAQSNAGELAGQALGIPDDWSVTSFSTTSTDAVGGILGKGDYVDVLLINEDGARYSFNNLLILEVKFVNEEIDGKVDGQTVIGEAMHYTVGMPADMIAFFHSSLFDYDTFKIIKAPAILNYAERDVSDLDKVFKYGPEVGNVDLFKGTDPTFTDVERDENGRPIDSDTEVEETEDIQETEKTPKFEDTEIQEPKVEPNN